MEVSPQKSKYESYDSITLTAVPSAGYTFESWTGEIGGIDPEQNPVIFVMGNDLDNNRHFTANFALSDVRYSVTAIAEPSGGGSIESLPEQTAEGYLVNETVTLRAVADEGYVFSHWTGDLGGVEESRTILVSENKSVTAVFNPKVTVYCSPSEGGSYVVEPESPGGYTVGTEVTISVEAAKGYRFVGWEGDASGSDRSITLTMDEPRTVTARFAERSSSSTWWLWVILGLVGLFGALVLVRLAYARMNRGVLDEPEQLDD